MLQFELAERPEGMLLSLVGDLDTNAAQDLDGRLEAIASMLDGDLVVDLGQLAYLNSTGVRSFIRLDKVLKRLDKRFRFRNVSGRIMRIFRYCGLDAYFVFEAEPTRLVDVAPPSQVH